jgi:hypothetical protein
MALDPDDRRKYCVVDEPAGHIQGSVDDGFASRRAVATRGSAARFLADNDQCVELAVLGRAEGERIERFIGPVSDGLLDHADCSLLVVRD